MALNPNYLYDNADVLWYGTEGYTNALSALQKVTGKSQQAVETMLNGKYGAADYWTACQALKDQGVVTAYNTNGVRCFAMADKVTMTAPTGPMYQVDSNATATTIVKANPVYDVVVDEVQTSPTVGKVFANPMGSLLTPQHGFYGWQYFGIECSQALQCASVGIALGKQIDSYLYNSNPDYWDSIGLSSLNPETWNTITNGDDSFAAGLFNMVLGINPNTGNGQMFIDANAFAYIAQALSSNGWFVGPTPEAVFNESSYVFSGNTYTITNNPVLIPNPSFISGSGSNTITHYAIYSNNADPVYCIATRAQLTNNNITFFFFSKSSFTLYSSLNNTTGYMDRQAVLDSIFNNVRVYWCKITTLVNYFNLPIPLDQQVSLTGNSTLLDCCTTPALPGDVYLTYLLLYGTTITETSGVDGVSNQPNATLPDVSTWTTPQDTLTSLQQQYPDLWANAVPNQITQPDGTVQTINYIPVPMPDANGQWGTQPTSSTSLQANPQVQPQTNPTPENNDLLRLLLQLVTLPETQTQTQTDTDIPNLPDTPDTGDGASPAPVVPTGSASALWSVYHPTQAQVNAFGGWLWSTDFVDQLIRVFENPMDAVVSLRKVFVTPVDAGNTTIHAGYLDSEVPSAYITQQYVYKDCGNINCYEQFGNVFDYLNTNISIYLPFIGIVPLNTSEVMRSTLHVIYGVDMFTGACLASIEVQRDGNTVTMYQYSGNASVEYPLSGQRASSFLGGLMSLGGAAAMAATGGGSVVAAGMAMHGVQQMSTVNVSHSGGFSGNAGAMGIKIPYLIIERPQTKVAQTFPRLAGYPTNHSIKLGECTNHVVVKHVHVEGINATDTELAQIESLLKDGVFV